MVEKVLIANRGECAIRVARACSDLGLTSVGIYPKDDAESLHVRKVDTAVLIPGAGAAAYLDMESIIKTAKDNGCSAVHPGYGFLSENASFAKRCAESGIAFVGPSPEVLNLFGNKVSAREFVTKLRIPTAKGTDAGVSLDDIRALMKSLGPKPSIMLKAVAGGGGRGMRVVTDAADLEEAWRRCTSEAQASFGQGAVYAEEYIKRARHIEVQIVGDGAGNVIHLFERECSAQRRHQKFVEIAPSPWLEPKIREALFGDATRIASEARYKGVGTVEFLVEIDEVGKSTGRYIFIEVNPRLQVEHTVTEEVLGLDIVQTQLRIASGSTLPSLGLTQPAIGSPRGYAMQLRVNMETLLPDGSVQPSGGTLTAYDPPSGAGIRVEGFGYPGYTVSSRYDPLLAKLVVHSQSARFDEATRKSYRALCEFRIDGVGTSINLLQNLLTDPNFANGNVDTGYIGRHAAEFSVFDPKRHPALHAVTTNTTALVEELAPADLEPGSAAIRATIAGQLVAISVGEGDVVHRGQQVAVIEAMKMEHSINAEMDCVITRISHAAGDSIQFNQAVLYARPEASTGERTEQIDTDTVKEALEAFKVVEDRRATLMDEARPEAIARARKRNAYTARERIAMLSDPASFTEIGGLVRAEDVGEKAPADGLVVGTGKIDGRSAVILSQDFSVFGGSGGAVGSAKINRAIEWSLTQGLPYVKFLDGGGHRIQDGQNSRHYAVAGNMLHNQTRMSGYVPIVSIAIGAGFAGNTNSAGLSDFVVMVRGKGTLGLAGPALVKAGTGETIDAQTLGGASMQVDRTGLADLAVDTEEDAIAATRRFLSYLPSNASLPPPRVAPPEGSDARDRAEKLLYAVPPNTRKNYDVRPVIALISDVDSVFEIKPTYARNMVTAFARMNGQPVGFIANQPLFLGGMIDANASEKAAHFVALCDAYALPLLYLIDVPGFAIGSEAEKTGLGRRSAKMLFELGHSTVPRISVVLRKGYGLGYVAMAGGRSFGADAAFAWPTAEICAMSVEGSVDVAYRKDYEAAPDPAKRRQEIIDEIRKNVNPLSAAEGFGIDDLIDPRDTRKRLLEVLARLPARKSANMPPKFRGIPPI